MANDNVLCGRRLKRGTSVAQCIRTEGHTGKCVTVLGADTAPRCGKLLRSGAVCTRPEEHSGKCHSQKPVKLRSPEEQARKAEYYRSYNERPDSPRGKRRALVDRIKLERGCIDCGFHKHPAALHFDHVRGTKLFNIANAVNRPARFSIEELEAEMDKCEVRCANCHAIRTFTTRYSSS
jgi:hypothetical protein